MKFKITYRAKERLTRGGIIALCVVLALLVVWSGWMVWLGRYAVYADGRVYFDFDRLTTENAVEVRPTEAQRVDIQYDLTDEYSEASTELTQLSGYYATVDDLVNDLDGVVSSISQLPAGSAVMLDLKSIYGVYLYSSDAAEDNISTQADIDSIDTIISELTGMDYYVIARMPALRDRAFGLAHPSNGLSSTQGAYLWYDENNCYWLDPTKAGTLEYLMEITDELEDLGFDEVVFTDFRFPDTENIVFTTSKYEALAQAARQLVEVCATDTFAVSFESGDPTFPLPSGRSRLYMTGVDAADVQDVAASVSAADKYINLVFVTDSFDTRFTGYSIMRPFG